MSVCFPTSYLATPKAATCAVASGALYALAFCGFDLHLLAWICLSPLLWALTNEARSPKQAMGLAWLAGLVAHLSVYTWLVYMLRHFAYLPWPLAWLGYMLLCIGQTTLFAAFGWLIFVSTQRSRAPMWLLAPACMTLCEWLVPALFPSYLANSQYRTLTMIQGCELWGVLGLTFILTLSSAVSAATVGRLLQRRALPWAGIAAFVLLFAINAGFGLARLAQLNAHPVQPERQVRIGLVQTNMGIYEKTENPAEGLRRHRRQSLELEAQGAELIIWPESGFYYSIVDGQRDVKREVLGSLRTPLLFGGLRLSHTEGGLHYYNTAFLSDADGHLLGSYDKRFLLMFGEYLPLGDWLPFLYSLSPQSGHFARGSSTKPLQLNGIKYGCLICYEDILPAYVRRVAAERPNVLINLTNDAWFGDTDEPKIHLALAVFRAVEHRRYLVRATNTGVSAIVEPSGRIATQSPVMQRANVLGTVVPLLGGTFYGWAGDWVGWGCLLSVAACLSPARLRRYARLDVFMRRTKRAQF